MRSLSWIAAWLLPAAYAVIPEVHGSGTTNPKTYFLEIMQIMEDRLKMDVRLSYRAVGSSTGQKEFTQKTNGDYTAGLNDFGSGDIPMTKDRWTGLRGQNRNMTHVPFCLGAIGIFHNVPAGAVGNDGLKLSPCVLAKIFSGQITTWDHVDVKADNPKLLVPAGQKILVGHRHHGSSSTGGFTKYLDQKCPDQWKMVGTGAAMGEGSSITWPVQGNFNKVEGSPGMTAFIHSTQYSIGYIDAGHGHLRKFAEVQLKNEDGTWLTSTDAITRVDTNGNNGVAAAGIAAVAAAAIPNSVQADWSAVNLNAKKGKNTWPIVLVSYIYLNKDMKSMSGENAGLLRAFVDFVTSTDKGKGQEMLTKYSFNSIPAAMNQWKNTRDSVIEWPIPTVAFGSEDATAPWLGQADSMVSVKRNSYPMWKLNELDLAVKALATRVDMMEQGLDDYGIVPLHGSGTTNPKTWFANAMKVMEHRARVPMLLTYRAVGSGTGQKEFLGQAANAYKSYSHFGAGDIPMSASNFKLLPERMLHLPFALGAIGIFHSIPSNELGGSGLKLDACLLSEIFSGAITTWDDAKLKTANPNLKVPAGQKILVGHRTLGSSSTGGTATYLAKACPDKWKLGTSSKLAWPTTDGFKAVQGSPGMQAHIKDNKYAIGYLDAGHGHDFDFSEVALKNKDGESRTSKEAIALKGVADAGDQGISKKAFPDDFTSDWSKVNLYDMPGKNTWPIVLVSYMYVKKDQSKMNKRTAAALKGFIEFILKDMDGLGVKFGFTAPPKAMREKTVAAADTIVYPPGMTAFTFETSTNAYLGMGDDVISAKRHSFDDYERATLAADIAKLKAAANASASASLTAAKSATEPAGVETLTIVALIISILSMLVGCCGLLVGIKANGKSEARQNIAATSYGGQAA